MPPTVAGELLGIMSPESLNDGLPECTAAKLRNISISIPPVYQTREIFCHRPYVHWGTRFIYFQIIGSMPFWSAPPTITSSTLSQRWRGGTLYPWKLHSTVEDVEWFSHVRSSSSHFNQIRSSAVFWNLLSTICPISINLPLICDLNTHLVPWGIKIHLVDCFNLSQHTEVLTQVCPPDSVPSPSLDTHQIPYRTTLKKINESVEIKNIYKKNPE